MAAHTYHHRERLTGDDNRTKYNKKKKWFNCHKEVEYQKYRIFISVYVNKQVIDHKSCHWFVCERTTLPSDGDQAERRLCACVPATICCQTQLCSCAFQSGSESSPKMYDTNQRGGEAGRDSSSSAAAAQIGQKRLGHLGEEVEQLHHSLLGLWW